MLAMGIGLLMFAGPFAGAAPETCVSSFEQARQYFETRHFDLAAGSFRQALESCPKEQHSSLLLWLARAQFVGLHAADSIQTLDRLLFIDPANTSALKLHADADYLIGREEEAERRLAIAGKIDPRDPQVPYALGRIYYQQHRYGEAVREFEASLALDSKSYKAYDNLGLCHEALGEDQEALAAYKKALDLVYKDHPDYDWAYANMAGLMIKRGDYGQAFQLAAEAAARNPRSARDCYLAGKALAKLDKWDLSTRWLKQSAQLDSQYAEPHYLLAQAYRKEGRDADAARELALFRAISSTQPRERR